MQDLIPLQEPNIPALFAPGGLDSLLDRIEAEARSMVPSLVTKRGRDAIASNAARVARSKTYLDDLGKQYVADLKALPGQVDAVRRAMRERLDALKEEVRAPLTAWERTERERQDAIKARIADMARPLEEGPALDCAAIQARLDAVSAIAIDDGSFAEFGAEATQVRDATLYRLSQQLERTRAAAIEAARIEAERRASAERARAERDARIAAEAAARATQEAEAAARAKLEAAARQTKALEQARQEAECRAAEAVQRQRDAEALAARQTAEAAQRQQEAERRAAEAERAAAAVARRRGAERDHAAAVNRAVLADLMALGLAEEQGRSLIAAISKGQVKHLSISY